VIILDTNVLSALMLKEPERSVIAWLDREPPESIWTTAVTTFEIGFGLARMAHGKRRTALETAFAGMLADELGDRLLAFDGAAARKAAALADQARRKCRSVEIRDIQIAGIASSRRATLATRNTKHFDAFGLRLVDPWKS